MHFEGVLGLCALIKGESSLKDGWKQRRVVSFYRSSVLGWGLRGVEGVCEMNVRVTWPIFFFFWTVCCQGSVGGLCVCVHAWRG